MIRRPPRSTLDRSSAASDVYKRQTHYPEAYMAAVLTADMDNTDRLVVLKNELTRNMGIALEPPDVNRSVLPFTVAGPKRISYGLGALKGVGPGAVEAIVSERNARGPY